MRLKVQNGTVANGETSLCGTCRYAMIVRGRSLDEEIVQCRAGIRGLRVTFKVTSCSGYVDERQPSVMQMMEAAWVLQPGSRRRPAGFVRGAELQQEEMAGIMTSLGDRCDEP